MQRLWRGLTRREFYLPLVLLVGVFVFMTLLVPRETNSIVLNGTVLGVWVLIVRAYGPLFVKNLRSATVNREYHLIAGILMLWTAFAASRVWSTAYILSGRPEWMQSHWAAQFFFASAAVSGFWFLSVPSEERVRCGYVLYAVLIAVAVATGAIVWLNLNLF